MLTIGVIISLLLAVEVLNFFLIFVPQNSLKNKCAHVTTKWVGIGGLENIGIEAQICETCGEEIEARAVYCDDKGNVLRIRKL